MRLSRFTINTHMKLFLEGATQAEQSRVRDTKNAYEKMILLLRTIRPFSVLERYR
jgi:hypothetical protein